MPCLSVFASKQLPPSHPLTSPLRARDSKHIASISLIKKSLMTSALLLALSSASQGHADSISALIAQKSAQSDVPVPSARISTRSTISRARTPAEARSVRQNTYIQPVSNNATYQSPQRVSSIAPAPIIAASRRYPEPTRQLPTAQPAFLSASYDNVDSEYLPILSNAEVQSSRAAREVISTARAMTLNERMIIKGGCWDYLNAVFNRAGVTRDTVHKGTYREGPYANSSEIAAGDWLYYINHGYNDIEHSGMFVGWVDKAENQALILSYAGESRREPARYRVYDLSHVYQIMRPVG